MALKPQIYPYGDLQVSDVAHIFDLPAGCHPYSARQPLSVVFYTGKVMVG